MERRFGKQRWFRRALPGILIAGVVASCAGENVMELKPGAEVSRKISAKETHAYELLLEADRFVEVTAEQEGVDVAVELYDPVGDLVVHVDSPIGRQGPETVVAVSEAAGIYRFEVHAVEAGAPAGNYRLRCGSPRPASRNDRLRADAERRFSQAEELRREESRESHRAALEGYEGTLPDWQELTDRKREADTRLRIGWVHALLDDFPAAYDALDAAAALYHEVGDRQGESKALNSQGGVRIQQRKYAEALPLIELALGIAEDTDSPWQTAECLNNLGTIHQRSGEVDAALQAYAKARLLYEKLGEPYSLAGIRFNLGVLLLRQGKLVEAADHLEEAAEAWTRLGIPRRAGRALTALGDVRKRQGRLPDALKTLEQARELRHKAEDRRGEGTTLNSLGTTYLLLGDHAQAETAYNEARTIFHELGDAREEALALVNLGRLHVVVGNPGLALEAHRSATPLLEASGDRTAEASNLYGMARALHDLKDFPAARDFLESSREKIEELRTETKSEGLRIAFFASRQHYYDLYVDVLMHLGDETAAFELSEQRRARALLDALGAAADEVRKHADPGLLKRERILQDELNELEQRRTKLRELRQRDEEAIAEMEKELRDKAVELETVRGEMRADLAGARPSSLEDVQILLKGRRTVLVYSLGDERSFLWRIDEEEIESHILPGREEIERAARAAHRLLTSLRSDVDQERTELLAQLSQILLGPVAGKLEGRRLVIVAEGALLYLPFAVLPDPGGNQAPDGRPRLLIEEHEIAYAPSVSVLRTLRDNLAERFPAPKQLAIFADPVCGPGGTQSPGESEEQPYEDDDLSQAVRGISERGRLDPLPHSREEAEAVLALTRGETLSAFGFEATKKKVLEGGLDQYQILHFATHAVVHPVQPELSGLVLSLFDEEGRYQDGYLRLHEIHNLNLPAELIVLSACETGLGAEVRGEGFLGLTRGFFHAGAARLVVSLWSVNDHATSELMKRFYWNLFETQTRPALALRAAQLEMLASEDWSHPFYWAGFVFQGAWWPPGEEPPIEGAQGGAVDNDESDPDYPGPDGDWCASLTEPWMKAMCERLQTLRDEPLTEKGE